MDNKYLRIWDSWHELIEHAASVPTIESSHTNGNDFNGGASFEDALDYARNGWTDGAIRALPRIGKIVTAITSKVVQHRIVTDVVPSSRGYDIPLMLSGTPEHWYRIDPNEFGPRQNIKLSISLCQSAGISPRVIEMKGAALAALAQAFELNGQSASIQVDYSTRSRVNGENEIVSDVCLIKRSDQPLDLANVIFAIGHAASLRRIGFALWENSDADRRAQAGVCPYAGYGSPQDCSEDLRGDIHIPSSTLYDNSVDWNNEGSVSKWIIAKLEQFGVTMAE